MKTTIKSYKRGRGERPTGAINNTVLNEFEKSFNELEKLLQGEQHARKINDLKNALQESKKKYSALYIGDLWLESVNSQDKAISNILHEHEKKLMAFCESDQIKNEVTEHLKQTFKDNGINHEGPTPGSYHGQTFKHGENIFSFGCSCPSVLFGLFSGAAGRTELTAYKEGGESRNADIFTVRGNIDAVIKAITNY